MTTAKEKKEAAEQAARAVSLNPEDMTEGGGLLDNVRGTVTGAQFLMSDYGGRSSMKRPAAQITIEEPDGTVHDDQFWSCGKAQDWMPSDDGKYLIPTGLKTQIHKSSNFGMLMGSLLDSGFPGDKFDADIGFLIGMDCHWQQVATGRDPKKSADGTKEYEDTCLCIAEVFKFPWEKAGAKSASGGKKSKPAPKKSAPKTAPDTDDGDDGGSDLSTEAQGVILGILAEADDGSMPKKSLAPKIMMARKGEDQKVTNQMLKMAFDDSFLGADDHPWTYADGVLTLG